jgi:hypothetical protein
MRGGLRAAVVILGIAALGAGVAAARPPALSDCSKNGWFNAKRKHWESIEQRQATADDREPVATNIERPEATARQPDRKSPLATEAKP